MFFFVVVVVVVVVSHDLESTVSGRGFFVCFISDNKEYGMVWYGKRYLAG